MEWPANFPQARFLDSFRVADITGQSLPTLEGSDLAWFDNACSLCHFPLPCTSPKQLDVDCDVVFFCAVFFAGEHDSVVRPRCRLKWMHCERHDWIGRKCMLTQRPTTARQHRPTEVLHDLPLSRPCRRTADPSSREKVPLENHALFFAVPISVIQEIGR